MESYDRLVETVQSVEDDVKKAVEKSNKAAGTRVRKAMQEIKKLAQQVREDVLKLRNTPDEGESSPPRPF